MVTKPALNADARLRLFTVFSGLVWVRAKRIAGLPNGAGSLCHQHCARAGQGPVSGADHLLAELTVLAPAPVEAAMANLLGVA